MLSQIDNGEFLDWDDFRYKDYKSHLKTVVVKISEKEFKFLYIFDSYLEDVLKEIKEKEKKTIREYKYDLELWEEFPDEMWNLLIFGDLCYWQTKMEN